MGKTVLIVFTGTGNSLYLSDKLVKDEWYFSDELLNGSKELPDDIERLGFVFPTHCFSLPYQIKQVIREIIAERDNSELGYVFGLTTCAGAPGLALTQLEDELFRIGISLSYANSIFMPDAYIPLVKSEPTGEKIVKILNEFEEKLNVIKKDLEEEAIKLPSHKFFKKFIYKISDKASSPKENNSLRVDSSKCDKCGLCIKVCPMDNIEKDDEGIKHKDYCVSCFACYHFCPQQAVKYKNVSWKYNPLVKVENLFRTSKQEQL